MSPRQRPSSTPDPAAARWHCGSRRAVAGGSAPPCSSAERVRSARATTELVLTAQRFSGAPWQRLYLRPEPHGHGALRATSPKLAWSEEPSARVTSRERCTPPSPSTVGALYCSDAGRFG